jgi:hypothetical protein
VGGRTRLCLVPGIRQSWSFALPKTDRDDKLVVLTRISQRMMKRRLQALPMKLTSTINPQANSAEAL